MPRGHIDRLTSFDASFLANERDGAHMAIGAVLVCEGEPPSRSELLAHVRGRLHLLPRLRQRLAEPPLGLGRPLWVDHPGFELDRHVRGATLPAPGGEEQFRELVGRLVAPPLDRAHPLWELWLVDGFAAGGFGIVYRTHHAMADGISAVDIGTLLFDLEPDAAPSGGAEPWEPRRAPSRPALLGGALRGLVATFGRSLRWIGGAIREPRRRGRQLADGLAGLWEVTWALARPAPKVPLNVPIGGARSFAWARCDLDELKRIKEALGGTVNDVSLAVATGALRRWLLARDVAVDGLELKALVPVSIRAEDEHGELGNKLTAMRGPLPVGISDPAARLGAIAAAMDALKASRQALGAEAIWGLNDWFRDFAPPLLLRPTAAINFSTRLFNLLVTNFPGPQVPLYVLGRELSGVYPVGFLARRHALAVAIISYNGGVGFGVLADPEAVADAKALAEHLPAAVEELAAAARVACAGDGDELAGDLRSRREGGRGGGAHG